MLNWQDKMNNITYTNVELRDMHYYYGVAGGNALAARRLYGEAFPNRRIPQSRMFSTIHQRLGEFGTFKARRLDAGRPRSTRTGEAEERVLHLIGNNPNIGVRSIAVQEDIPKSSVHEIVKEQLLYPFHYKKVQALTPEDPVARVNFCNTMRNLLNDDQNLISSILFTDEAGFGHNGIFNLHNEHYWCDENPHLVVEHGYQNKFAVNVWAGIIGDHLIGPHFFPQRLNGAIYLDFLRNQLPILLEDVPLGVRNEMWLLHDGAPPHYAVGVRDFLNETLPERWIGRGGFVEWAPRSPDLNPMDFFFWGYLKTLVYRTPVHNVEELRQRIIDNCEVIKQKEGIFARVRWNFQRRINLCSEMEGYHFENLL